MAKFCGTLFIIKIEDPLNPGTFINVGGVQTDTLTINDELVDVTDKGSGGWREGKPECTILSMSLSSNGFVTDAAGFAEAHAKMFARSAANFQITSELGDQYEGPFQITTLERGGEYNGAETMTLSMESVAAITYTDPP